MLAASFCKIGCSGIAGARKKLQLRLAAKSGSSELTVIFISAQVVNELDMCEKYFIGDDLYTFFLVNGLTIRHFVCCLRV